MSIDFIRAALEAGNDAEFLRYARLHLGDGEEDAGRTEIDRAYVIAIRTLLESPETQYEWTRAVASEWDRPTLAHLFSYLHLELIRKSGQWVHDGEL